MKVYQSIEDFPSDIRTIVTIGTFDGVHKGHKAVINRINDIAKKEGLESVLLTFFPHPRHVLYPEDQELKLINTIEEKSEALSKTGLHNLVVHKFTKEFSRTKSVNFIRDILVNKINMKYMVVGFDHHFGKNREGTFQNLIELSYLYDFKIERIEPQNIDGITISSTKIRNALLKGEVQKANALLGYNYIFSGKVVHGNKLGRTIGFPTANIKLEDNKILPKVGVYAVKLEIDGHHYFGMLCIGDETNKIEVHVFNFSDQIYDQYVSVQMFTRLRDNKIMSDVETLKDQLIEDESNCKYFFRI